MASNHNQSLVDLKRNMLFSDYNNYVAIIEEELKSSKTKGK